MSTLEYEWVHSVTRREVEYFITSSPVNLMQCTFDYMWDVAAQAGYDMLPGQLQRTGVDPVLYSWPVRRRDFCGRCYRTFDPGDPAPHGVARHEGGRFCRGCVVRCRTSTGRHWCTVCLAEGRAVR